MFLLTVYISKLISSISSTNSNLFSYVPEVYVEVVLEIFQSLTKMEGRFGEHLQLELLGLQHVISFLINHFDNEKIINPQICDTMLQTLGTVFADKVPPFDPNSTTGARSAGVHQDVREGRGRQAASYSKTDQGI